VRRDRAVNAVPFVDLDVNVNVNVNATSGVAVADYDLRPMVRASARPTIA